MTAKGPREWLEKYPKAKELLEKCYYPDRKTHFYQTFYFKPGVSEEDKAEARRAVDRFKHWMKYQGTHEKA